jgi:tetratricopeptide (TPR) repeat protein
MRIERRPDWKFGIASAFLLVLGFGFDEPPKRPLLASKKVSETEALAFADKVEKAAAAGDAKRLNEFLDWNALLETATANDDAPKGFREAALQGARKTLHETAVAFAEVAAAKAKGGSYQFLRLRERDGRRSALFRLLDTADGPPNYAEWLLARDSDGEIRGVDIFIFGNAEYVGQSMRRMYLRGIGSLAKGGKSATDFQNDVNQLSQARALASEGKFPEAKMAWEAQSPAHRDDKSSLVVLLDISHGLGYAEYARSIERIRSRFPGDPTIDIFLIDGYFLAKKYDESLAAIDRLDRTLGGDPYLDDLRAGVLIQAGRIDEAVKVLHRLIEAMPKRLSCYRLLVQLDLKQKDYKDTLATLKKIDARFDMKFNDMSSVPAYAGFVKSPEYAEWQAYLKAKPKPPAEEATPTSK